MKKSNPAMCPLCFEPVSIDDIKEYPDTRDEPGHREFRCTHCKNETWPVYDEYTEEKCSCYSNDNEVIEAIKDGCIVATKTIEDPDKIWIQCKNCDLNAKIHLIGLHPIDMSVALRYIVELDKPEHFIEVE